MRGAMGDARGTLPFGPLNRQPCFMSKTAFSERLVVVAHSWFGADDRVDFVENQAQFLL